MPVAAKDNSEYVLYRLFFSINLFFIHFFVLGKKDLSQLRGMLYLG